MYALRDITSGKLLSVEPATETKSDWGYDGQDERMMDFTESHLRVYVSDYPQYNPVFVTANKAMAYGLTKKKKWDSIRLDAEPETVIVVKLKEKRPKHRRKDEATS